MSTITTYALDGVATRFPVSFEYLARKFVKVILTGASRQPLVLVTDFVFEGSTQVRLLRAWGPADGYTNVEIRRETSTTELIVSFNDATVLRAGDLNVSAVQSLHIAEEARDAQYEVVGMDPSGNIDARSHRIVNLADPIGEFDAVNLRSVNREYSGIYATANEALGTANSAYATATTIEGKADAALAAANLSLGRAASTLEIPGYDPTGTVDCGALVNAFMVACKARGIYTLHLVGILKSSVPIMVPAGMLIDGGVMPGYYSGMPWYAADHAITGPRGRILAGATMDAVVTFEEAGNSHGGGLARIILDGAKRANFCLYDAPTVLTERRIRLSTVAIQGAKLDGIKYANGLVHIWDDVNVSACGRFAVSFAYGVSDSMITGLYAHTCDAGGVELGTGSLNNQFWGGKIEDNYGSGVSAFGSTGAYFHGTSINVNNGAAVDNNGATIVLNNCNVFNHIYQAAIRTTGGGSTVQRGGSMYGNKYNYSHESGRTLSDGVDLGPGTVANMSAWGEGFECINYRTGNNPVAMFAPGSKRLQAAIPASGSQSFVFKNAIEGGLGAAYFDMKSYMFTLSYGTYPQAGECFVGIVICGHAGGTQGAIIKELGTHSALLSSITASILGNDIVVSVTVSDSWGAISGHTGAYATLSDFGHNAYR